MSDFTGYSIRLGFLDGNLGDCEQYADEYAAAIEDAISEAFPGASVEILRQRNASGSEPCAFKTTVYNSDDFEDMDAAERVDRICQSVWEQSEKWIPANCEG